MIVSIAFFKEKDTILEGTVESSLIILIQVQKRLLNLAI